MESYPKVSQVEPLPNCRLRITFQNGIVKEYDCSPLLEKTVFHPLREVSLFNQVAVGVGGYGIVWNDDIDLSEAELWLNGVALEKPVSEVPTPKPRQIALVYRKMRIDEEGSDFAYWQSRPPIERLKALEEIRREYHGWEYGREPRIAKVVTIKKRRGADYYVVERFTEGRMSIQTLDQHIEITPGVAGGKPRIAGRRITVQNIAIWHEYMGLSADEIAAEHDLSLGDIYAALAYYFDNRPEIERQIAEDNALADTLRTQTPSLLHQRLTQDEPE